MLLIGPPGSGKTRTVLDALEAALDAGRADRALLVTPTASMAQHLLHELARKGRTVPGDLIVTLSKSVERLTPSLLEPSRAVLFRLLHRALEQMAPAEFRALADAPGLQARLFETIGELEAAGVAPELVEGHARRPEQRAFCDVFAAYEELLRRNGFVSSGARLLAAARSAEAGGLVGVEEVFFDGFFDLSFGERELVHGLSRAGVDVTVTLPEAPPPDVLPSFPRRTLTKVFRAPVKPLVVAAPTMEQEVEEVARRILEERRTNQTPLREIGVILRSPEECASAIQAVFERYGIPFRLRRSQPLGLHPAAATAAAALAALAEGFPGEKTLDVLRRPCCRVGSLVEADRWDFDVRERLPLDGIEELRANAPGPVAELLDHLADREWWRDDLATPAEWARRTSELARLILTAPAAPDRLSSEHVRELRAAGAARSQFDQAADAATELVELDGATQVGLAQYLAALEEILLRTPLLERDERREVVNVLSAYEARQWELDVVFVLGLVEGRFPTHPPQNLLFGDQDRTRLQREGVELRTGDDRERDEELLFRIACSRARRSLVLSYPQADASGAPLLRSFFLPAGRDRELAATPVKPLAEAPAWSEPSGVLVDAGLLAHIRDRHRRLSPSSIERFLQCPFQFFAEKTLRLKPAPRDPFQRLNALLKGSIVHETIALWSRNPGAPIAAALDEVFDEALAEQRLPKSFQTEMVRVNMLADLERFAAERSARPAAAATESAVEEKIEYAVEGEGVGEFLIGGRIDRFDVLNGKAAVVIDYKYSAPDRINKLRAEHEQGLRVQGPLYLSGLQRTRGLEPGGVAFWGLRKETSIAGWALAEVVEHGLAAEGVETVDEVFLADLIANAEKTAGLVMTRVRAGAVDVEPHDRGFCKKFCDFRDACRIKL